MQNTYVIVGLGNPGEKYANTLHNAGYMVVDELAKRHNATFKTHKTQNLIAECTIGVGIDAPKIILIKPCSYMNLSGGPVKAALKFFNQTHKNLIVIHDELDITRFTLKTKIGGGEGGHNGLKSISQSLGTKEYTRMRYGIGRPNGRIEVADYVLSPFPKKDETLKEICIQECADSIEEICTIGYEKAQQNLHTSQGMKNK